MYEQTTSKTTRVSDVNGNDTHDQDDQQKYGVGMLVEENDDGFVHVLQVYIYIYIYIDIYVWAL